VSGSVPTWSTAIQLLVAGVVVALCALQAGWLRGEGQDRVLPGALRSGGAAWILYWSLALVVVTLLNGLATLVPAGPATELVLALRFAALGAGVTLSLPAVQAFTGGPSVRLLTAATATWYIGATVLWLGTDLLYGHQTVGGLPQYGVLATAVDLVPVMGLGLYVARVVQVTRLTAVGALVTVAGFASATLLIASSIPPPSDVTELLKGVWVLPIVVGMQIWAASGITTVRRESLRRTRMRDALARVGNVAWLAPTTAEVLAAATEAGREVLGDPTVTATLRHLEHDRFVTEFRAAPDRTTDDDERAFLQDLARVVSGAAERQALTDRVCRAASFDALTGLANRPSLDRHLSQTLEAAARDGSGVALLFCDLDGFKLANDRHGHSWGDQLLVHTATHLRDVLGGTAYLARHGGDEFVAVLPDAPDTAVLLHLARRLRAEIDPPGDDVARPGLTVGVATWAPDDVPDPAGLLREADLAMLEAKRSHAGVGFFDERMRAEVASRAQVRAELETALVTGGILAHFQPLTDAMTLEVTSLEVLARWQHDGRLRPPAEWLPLAEETGLIVEVGRQMFIAARAGMERFDLPVAVNVAARQLDEPDFVRHVEESWGTDAWDRLTIEVTESALLYDALHVRASLTALAARGVKIALDDFGTGYNSLSRLSELPLHVLKIDRAFVHDIGTTQGAAVLRAILALAEAHGLEVVAEGVERLTELTALIDMGVVTVQGHMLGRPSANLPVRARSTTAPTQRTGPDAVAVVPA